MDRNAMLNEMLYRMEEVFWHELSDCAPWKTEYVGIDFIQSQDINGANEDEVIRSCIARIKAAGLVDFPVDSILILAVRGSTTSAIFWAACSPAEPDPALPEAAPPIDGKRAMISKLACG